MIHLPGYHVWTDDAGLHLRISRWWLLVIVIGIALSLADKTGAQVPPRAEQPHPDQFQYNGESLAIYSTLHSKAKSTRAAAYSLITISGCTSGVIPQAMQRVEAELNSKVGFRLTRNDAQPDFVVKIGCGSEQIRQCGAVNIFCLPEGFPANNNIWLSDILSSYASDTQLAIPLHEVLHAVAVWNEQYCTGTETTGICRGLARFSPAPGWRDFMNTGELSRHGFEAIEVERWINTMYLLAIIPTCGRGDTDPSWGGVWDSCVGRWFAPNGFSVEPGSWTWWNPQGQPEWTAGNADRLRWNIQIGAWFPCDDGFFLPARGYWSFAPGC